MLTKIKRKVRGYFRRRLVDAEFKAFMAGVQYGQYLANKEMKDAV